MADNVKGITIQIGGDVQPLNQALQEATKSTQSYSKQLSEINKKLKLDPKNIELLTEKHNVLTKAVEVGEERVQGFKEAYEKAFKGLETGETTKEQVDAISRGLQNATQETENWRQELQSTDRALENAQRTQEHFEQQTDETTESVKEQKEELQQTGEAFKTFSFNGEEVTAKFREMNGAGVDLATGLKMVMNGTYKMNDAILALNPTNILTLVSAFGMGAIKLAEYADGLSEVKTQQKLLDAEITKTRDAWKKEQYQVNLNTTSYLVLFRRVMDLNDQVKLYQQTGKDTTQVTKQLEFWSNQLNDTVGESVVTYDKETGTLKENNAELTKRYQNLRNNAIMEAQAERLKELYVQQYEQQKLIAQYQEKIDSGVREWGTSYEYLKTNAEKALGKINEEIDGLERENAALISQVDGIGSEYYTAGKESATQYSKGFNSNSYQISNAVKSALSVLNTKIKTTAKPGGITTRVEYLANGGIVTRPTLAMIGEGGSPEAVIPLDKLGGIIEGALKNSRQGGGSYSMNVYPRDMSASQQDMLFNKFDKWLGGKTSRESI